MATKTEHIDFTFDSTIQPVNGNRVPSRKKLKAILRKQATQELKRRLITKHGAAGFDSIYGNITVNSVVAIRGLIIAEIKDTFYIKIFND